MKAVRFHEYGGPEVLHYEDAPDPVRGSEEVLIRVKACALNRLDIWGQDRAALLQASAAPHPGRATSLGWSRKPQRTRRGCGVGWRSS